MKRRKQRKRRRRKKRQRKRRRKRRIKRKRLGKMFGGGRLNIKKQRSGKRRSKRRRNGSALLSGTLIYLVACGCKNVEGIFVISFRCLDNESLDEVAGWRGRGWVEGGADPTHSEREAWPRSRKSSVSKCWERENRYRLSTADQLAKEVHSLDGKHLGPISAFTYMVLLHS